MASGTSLLDPGSLADIRQLRRDGMATALASADPAISLVFTRPNATGEPFEESDPVDVVMTFDKVSSVREVGTDSGGEAPITGRMKAFEPWDVLKGDTFTLDDGRSGEITVVYPER